MVRAKLNLVSMKQMTNEHKVVVIWLDKLQQTHGKHEKDAPPITFVDVGKVQEYTHQ